MSEVFDSEKRLLDLQTIGDEKTKVVNDTIYTCKKLENGEYVLTEATGIDRLEKVAYRSINEGKKPDNLENAPYYVYIKTDGTPHYEESYIGDISDDKIKKEKIDKMVDRVITELLSS